MEKSLNRVESGEMKLDWMDLLCQEFQLEDLEIRTYSPLTFAYIGDGVYELIVRTILVKRGNCPVNKLHRRASALVRASAQSKMMEALEPALTPEEERIYKRGRNAHPSTMAKNATMGDYRRATGFEALIGWLYLTGRQRRMMDLVKIGISYMESEEKTWTGSSK